MAKLFSYVVDHDYGFAPNPFGGFCTLAKCKYGTTKRNIVELAEADELFSRPLHPYTQALLSAVPSTRPGVTKARILLSGDVPSPLDPPAGCRFHTRCPKAMRQCKTEEPRWQEVERGHYTACHLYA